MNAISAASIQDSKWSGAYQRDAYILTGGLVASGKLTGIIDVRGISMMATVQKDYKERHDTHITAMFTCAQVEEYAVASGLPSIRLIGSRCGQVHKTIEDAIRCADAVSASHHFCRCDGNLKIKGAFPDSPNDMEAYSQILRRIATEMPQPEVGDKVLEAIPLPRHNLPRARSVVTSGTIDKIENGKAHISWMETKLELVPLAWLLPKEKSTGKRTGPWILSRKPPRKRPNES